MNPEDDITTQEVLDIIGTLQNRVIELIKKILPLERNLKEIQSSLGYILTRVGEVETLLQVHPISKKKSKYD